MKTDKPEHLPGNIEGWQKQAADYVAPAERAWASDSPYWGVWQIPEADVDLLPADLTGKRAIEIGCGAGYVSAWLARRGASVVGIDPTPGQLATANRLAERYNLGIEFIEGFGESLPFPDASFDFAISEYGASLWADPYRWIPEASRVLVPGGRLVFLTNSIFTTLCVPDYENEGAVTRTLKRPYFGLYKIRWPDAPGQTEFHLTHGDWIALFRANRLRIERLVEMKPRPDATTLYEWADLDWALDYPTEDAWVLTRE